MTISNVVLDRSEYIVTFRDSDGDIRVRGIVWNDNENVWRVMREAETRFNLNRYLKGISFEGSQIEALSLPEESKPDQVKQPRYLKEDGTDTIDKWAATRSHEVFREIMYAQVEKYNDRLGKKAPILEEVTKMADYMNRWVEYEKIWSKEDAD